MNNKTILAWVLALFIFGLFLSLIIFTESGLILRNKPGNTVNEMSLYIVLSLLFGILYRKKNSVGFLGKLSLFVSKLFWPESSKWLFFSSLVFALLGLWTLFNMLSMRSAGY